MSINLRNVSAADDEIIYSITDSAMREHVEKIFGPWIEDYQRKLIKEKIDRNTYRIIQLDGVDVGLIVVENEECCIRLSSIFLLPMAQNKGIGTQLLHELQLKASRQNLPLRVRVLACNPARFWYQREGFVTTEKTPERWFMEWKR